MKSKSKKYNRDIDDIINNPVFVREENETKIRWIKIPWVSRCEYHSDCGVAIKLNVKANKYIHMHIICGIVIIHVYIHIPQIMGNLKKKPDQKTNKDNSADTLPAPDRLNSNE